MKTQGSKQKINNIFKSHAKELPQNRPAQPLEKQRVLGAPFNFTFMDEDFNNLYRTEQRMGVIAISFSALAMACSLVACSLKLAAIFVSKPDTACIGNELTYIQFPYIILQIIQL